MTNSLKCSSDHSINRLRYSVLIFLSCMALNYLNYNVFGRQETILLLSRLFAILILIYMLARAPVFTKNELVFLCLSALSFIVSAFENLLAVNVFFLLLFVVATKRVPIQRLVDNFFYILCATIAVVFLLLLFGILENKLDSTVIGDRIRWRFGFLNVNAFGALVYSIVLLALFRLNIKKASLAYYFLTFSFFCYMYLQTGSRTLGFGIVMYCLIYLCFLGVKSNLLLKILALVGLILPVIFINNLPQIISFVPIVDRLLSYRGTYAVMYMSGLQDWYIFLGGVSSSGKNTDMGLVLIQSSLGFLFLVYLMIQTYLALSKSIKLRLPNIYAFILSFWVCGLSESPIIRPESIIGLVFWVLVIRSNEFQSAKKHINLAD